MNKSTQRALQVGLSSLVIVFAACSQDASTETAEPAPAPHQAPAAENETSAIGDQLTSLVNNAVADVASQTGIASADIKIVQASTVNWASGALGCPEGDKAYTQALVPGP
jgi:hypothetical protein